MRHVRAFGAGLAGGVAGSLLVLGLLGAGAGEAVRDPKVIRAHLVEVTDEAGEPRITMSAGRGTPMVMMYDGRGKLVACLGVGRRGDAYLSFHRDGASDDPAMMLGMMVEGKPAATFYGEKGKVIWKAP